MSGNRSGPHLRAGSIPTDTGTDSRSAWGRVVVKLFTRTSNNQWLDNFIASMKVIKNASGLAPFPYLGIAAGITVQILEIIQVSQLLMCVIWSYLTALVLVVRQQESRRFSRPCNEPGSDHRFDQGHPHLAYR